MRGKLPKHGGTQIKTDLNVLRDEKPRLHLHTITKTRPGLRPAGFFVNRWHGGQPVVF
ncbi:phage minor tail protein G [Acetobacter orientalis]|uniref:Phage minor tail protein G n=1 Tax=Acetobacter orientalis TaxID=146474 RepID=A0A2Z5ZF57_9PROT|nr:phage minor tail protein G [Acetobacter orientalis]